MTIVECYKLELRSRETNQEAGVNLVTVPRLWGKFKVSEEREMPCHIDGGGRRPRISGTTLAHMLEEIPTTGARQLEEQSPMLLQEASI